MAKLHRLPWQTPIPLPTLRLTPSTVEAPLRIASRISPRLMPSHRQMISGSFVLAMTCLWGVKREFGCASRNAAVFSARYLQFVGAGQPRGFDSDQTEKSRSRVRNGEIVNALAVIPLRIWPCGGE